MAGGHQVGGQARLEAGAIPGTPQAPPGDPEEPVEASLVLAVARHELVAPVVAVEGGLLSIAEVRGAARLVALEAEDQVVQEFDWAAILAAD